MYPVSDDIRQTQNMFDSLIFDILIYRSSIIMYHLIGKIEILIFGFKVFGLVLIFDI